MKKEWVYWFWGAMDLFFLGWYCVNKLKYGIIPFYPDAKFVLGMISDYGLLQTSRLWVQFALVISSVISMYLFFGGSRWAPAFTCCQIPMRIYLFVPSLSVVFWMSKSGLTPLLPIIVLLLVSEVLKVLSLSFRDKLFPA